MGKPYRIFSQGKTSLSLTRWETSHCLQPGENLTGSSARGKPHYLWLDGKPLTVFSQGKTFQGLWQGETSVFKQGKALILFSQGKPLTVFDQRETSNTMRNPHTYFDFSLSSLGQPLKTDHGKTSVCQMEHLSWSFDEGKTQYRLWSGESSQSLTR